MSEPVLHTPKEWQDIIGLRIVDPQGWRVGEAPPWDARITGHEFIEMASVSTVSNWNFDYGARLAEYEAEQVAKALLPITPYVTPPAHLVVSRTPQGFSTPPAIQDHLGGVVELCEGSEPETLWITLRQDSQSPYATRSFSTEDAWRLADQLRFMVRNHSEGDLTPEWAAD